jgi:Flp pilus assembly pilin Flp
MPKGVKHHMLMNYVRSLLAQLSRGEEGQTAVEYGLVLALISAVVVTAVATGLTDPTTGIVKQVMDAIAAAF